jgi:hypothetical protein
MPLITYKPQNFHKPTLRIIEQANIIINEWQAKGYLLTLRQIYYRFIALDWFPASWIDTEYNHKHKLPPLTKNTIKNYKKLGGILSDARLGGLIDWDAMEDRTRNLMGLQHWESPEDAIKWLSQQYRIQKDRTQDWRIEVWVEKDALIGIFERVCTEADIDVAYISLRGYNSQSEMWGAAQRIIDYEHAGQKTLILQFSDHDPSGIDMFRDIRDRLRLFGCGAVIRRMGLTIGQVRKLDLPPNPAKETDIRFEKYVERFGNESWELDALEPDALAALVRKGVKSVRNVAKWEAKKAEEKKHIAKLLKFSKPKKKAKKKKTTKKKKPARKTKKK